ncbi:glucose-1-phosphatase-like [Plodia interpunctella]|uniref:glucose-1-phosphatase-like n=1 Tax=Plodia interpunctella TaxID=58824 RepID=UPI002368402D|nr:glucose-1-phosphatase-like [Plodia interpunctella]
MFIIVPLIILASVEVNALYLKQVVFFSRHNIRAPLSKTLDELTEKKWPEWKTESAHLTPKGALLEGYMGEYFSKWLKAENFFQDGHMDEHGCPNSVHIYANAPQRTVATAKAFTKSAFPNCDIKVNFKENVIMDPVFHPVLRDTSAAFREIVINDIQKKLDELKLEDAYELINNIVEIKSSKLCVIKGFCDLTKRKDHVLYEIGEEPNLYGPLSIGNNIVDVFLMSLYQGHKMEDIAWGKIRTPSDWKILTKITKENQNVRFNGTFSKHLAEPLLDYMSNLFLNNSAPKLTGLFGHDSNLKTVMSALGFKPYELPRQHELTPIGGKLVFQKWYDVVSDRDLLKVDYIYPSVGHLRFSTKFWDEEPPETFVMQLHKCEIDENGFCPWNDFVNILRSLN